MKLHWPAHIPLAWAPRQSSLKTRILLVVVALLVLGIWGLAARVSAVLQADIEQVLSEQLSATVGYMAADIDSKIQLRIDMLSALAADIGNDILPDANGAQRILRQRNLARELFSTGVFIANNQGRNIADYPSIAGRVGGFIGDRAYFRDAMASGKPVVSAPFLGRFSKQPVISLAVPIHDAAGRAAGALVAGAFPSDPSLFGNLERSMKGKAGYFLVMSPRDQLIVSATDRSLILKPLPAKGVNSLHDRRVYEGFEGAGIAISPMGGEALSVSRHLKTTGWIVVAAIPSEEAYAPISAMKRQIYGAALLISLLIALILRFLMGRQLAPLAEAGAAIQRMSTGETAFTPIPVRREDEIGKLVGSFNRLIEERKRAEESSKEGLENFRALTEMSADWFWEQDANFRYTHTTWGITTTRPDLGKILGKTRWELPIVNVSEAQWQAHRQTLEEHRPFKDFVYQIETKPGRLRWFSMNGSPRFGADGEFLGYRGVGRDITERKCLDEELRRHRDHLEELVQERNAELRQAQRIGHMGNWHWDIAGNRLTWSDEIFRIFGHPPGAFTPTYERFMACIHPDDAADVKQCVKSALADGGYNFDCRIVLPNGEVRWMHDEAFATLDTDGKPISLTGAAQDITERKLVEQALVDAREAAEAANLAKSSFLSSMSHELRTPLNAVLGYAQLLAMDEHASQDTHDNAAEIEKAGRHLLALVNDILDLARIESGRMEINIEDVELSEVLADCRRLIEPQAQARSIALDLPSVPVSLRADRVRLCQVLLNLLSNAVKYNRDGGNVSVRGTLATPGGYRISITDTGPGIPAERIGELFQPFNRIGAERGSIDGTGIGLVITRSLVGLMAGRMGVESVAGAGSTFWVELPLASS